MGERLRPFTDSDISSREGKRRRLLTAATLADRLSVLARDKHVPLLALRVADLERIAWREGRVCARRFERRAREAFARFAREGMRAADLPAHDWGSEIFAIALVASARRDGAAALPPDCRSTLTRTACALRRLVPLSLETGWTLVTGSVPDGGTLEKVLQSALQRGELERQRYDFFAGVAHEMRTPLTAIRGYLETMLEKSVPPRHTRRFVEIARNETLRLGRLIDGMFEISLLDVDAYRRNGTSGKNNAAIRTALDSALSALGPHIRERRAQITLGSIPQVNARIAPDHLVQILINVIGNALDHGREAGRIAIHVFGDARTMQVAIEDDGPGVPACERDAIFTFGYRARSSGTGLGLALVRRLLERAGGEVYASDSSLGGVRIVISLPSCA